MGPPSPSWSSGRERKTQKDEKLEVFYYYFLYLSLSFKKNLKTNVLSGKVRKVRITHSIFPMGLPRGESGVAYVVILSLT